MAWQRAARNHRCMTTTAPTVLDRVLEVFDHRGLSACELRVLLKLFDREASLSEIAEALGKPPSEVTRAGRRLATRGLVRWYHLGAREESRLVITTGGLATIQALLAAAERAAEEHEPQALTAA